LGLFGNCSGNIDEREFYRKRCNIPNDGIAIANIGFEASFKGIDVLLGAFKKLISDYPNVYLVQIGVDDKVSELPNLSMQLGIQERVLWVGIVDHGWKWLNAADIYVQPSVYGEGLPLAIIEAMSMKLPVVATNIAGNVEAVNNMVNGIICKAGSEDSMYCALKKIIAERLSWRDMGMKGYQIYREVFNGYSSIALLIKEIYRI
jgi:glycosyltransferase involved in cell wall biosynthesis